MDTNAKIKHFEKALESKNEYIRRAASDELALLMYNGNEISSTTMKRLRREVHGSWAAAFNIVDNANRNNVLSFMLGLESNGQHGSTQIQRTGSFNEARLFVLQEIEKQNLFLTEKEYAAINGHHSVSRLRYNEALNFFRTFQEHDNNGALQWSEQLPELFIEYPNLVNDLGRAFQYTQSGNEGLNLFIQWEANLLNDSFIDIDSDLLKNLRYSLNFFAGRIARRIGGSNEHGITLFEKALSLTHDEIQRDACIWYILDMSIESTENVIIKLEKYIPGLLSGSANDILGRLLHRLVVAQNWENIVRVFNLIENNTKPTVCDTQKAAFAWIISRAIEEGFIGANSNQAAERPTANSGDIETKDRLFYLRTAYNASWAINTPSLYYRLQSADALDLPFFETPLLNNSNNKQTPLLQFLLGFFDYGAENLSISYIRSFEREMSPFELRTVAQLLSDAGMYNQAIRLISLYINNDGYQKEKKDLELFFPQPYLELIEMYANEFNIEPSLVFGLIRTESAFQSAVVSRAGAVGLTQLMPATAQDMASRIRRSGGPNFFDVNNSLDLSDPFMNVYTGSFYFNYLMGRFENTALALMAYNGGQTRVRRWLSTNTLPVDMFIETVPFPETRDYPKRVLGAAAIYRELYYKN